MARTTLDIAISVMPEQKAWVDAIASETGMSRSEVFRWMADTIMSLNIKPIIIRSTTTGTTSPPTNKEAAD